ncbi:MAG: exodeoxyribonuclease III [Candidatus Gracilibacteria bacterium]|nr:exodeoxyribonuclease III [Candidatus Gracilibacteria bacterium]
MRLLSWNVNGIRAVQKKGFLEWFGKEAPDILCLQETKADPSQLDDALLDVPGYKAYWSSAEKKGYSGVALYTKQEPLSVAYDLGIEEFDREGRLIIAEYEDFYLLNCYFPNGKSSEERLQFKMSFYAAFLELCERLRKKKPLIFCGDVNTAHKPIDLARPKENEDISGFLPIERKWLDELVAQGYVDTFRHFYPEEVKYSWWSMRAGARARNVGWRIDYFFMTDDYLEHLKEAFILPDVMGSDHCPVGLTIS